MLLALQCLVIFLIFLYWIRSKNKEFDKIPRPPGVLFLHNTLDFLSDTVPLFYQFRMLSNKYKRLFGIKLGPVNAVFINYPEDIEKVINGSAVSEKGLMYDFVEPWLKQGLLLSEGSKWHKRRKLLTRAFTFSIMSTFKSVIVENCQTFLGKLEKEVNASKTNIMPFIEDFVIHSICETAMGTKLDEEDINFGKLYREGIYKLGQCAFYRAQRVWFHPTFTFKFTEVGKKQEDILKIMNSFRDRVIQSRRKFYNNNKTNIVNDFNDNENDIVQFNGKVKMPLLDLLLEAEKDGVIDEKGIAEEVDTFMLGGLDTTANTIQFTMMLLANHQDAQEMIVNECNNIFGSSDRSATMADLAQMKYLECCIKESMRLYPPIPIINRKVQQTLTLGKSITII
ncbi:cytochrome P450 4C1-like [Bicyclus anynana]|uniref:Cytochrome P450 4C1-like n=1 Tax=Bicyclus anynana TaxID=110368 RepID=A0ABM3LDV4_BICAN|nr:cytochrome P450 4C1-like [Bicyclus anynana]XP_052737238.1 cytochrome P450 4C1-like [Bicyclus anynana]